MALWTLPGLDRRLKFQEELQPNALKDTLSRYRKTLGKEFSIADLLALEDIRVKALIAEAINDVPEFLIHEIYKARHEDGGDSISDSLSRIADGLEGIGLQRSNNL